MKRSIGRKEVGPWGSFVVALLCSVLLPVVSGCNGVGTRDRTDAALQSIDFREVVRRTTDKVFPSVVFVKCLRQSHEQGKKTSEEIWGSGVIISAKGELLTNWHVVDKATEIRCLLYDGRAMGASTVGTDKDTDLALLQLRLLDGVEAVPHANLGDSTVLKQGNFIMAMGAPWGLSRSVSIGIIACTDRYLEGGSQYNLWLQTDASISPGNSGGPLVNTQGEVVGITTLGALFGGNLAFAIPSETIKVILPQLRKHGKVNWSWTGLQVQPLRDFNKNMYFDFAEGVIVAGTDPESPARRAGIQPRDLILEIAGEKVTARTDEDLPAVRRLIGLLQKGQPASLKVLRKGKETIVRLTPREKGKVEGEELDCPRWDLTVKMINQFDNPDLYFHRKKGVFIYGIEYPGNASNADLRRQDIILKIDGEDIATLEDVKRIHKESLKDIEKKHRITFALLRNGLPRQVVLDFLYDYEKE